MTYQEALAYLDSFVNYEKSNDFDYKKSFKLERMRSFSHLFGDPHREIPAIHIGGTKGKGSVSSFIHSVLMAAGYKVGLYTSPHLFSLRERIRINGEAISEDDVAKLMEEIRPRVEMIEKETGEKPTYFEACTMMAFLYFRRERAQFMVLEVGMGGRLDSTNITEALISVITPVSYDHTKYLGKTLRDIALEKCGIIKNNSVVISAHQPAEAMDVIERVCEERGAKLYIVGRNIFFETFNRGLEKQDFSILTPQVEYPHLSIRLLGDFQVENAATAVAAVDALRLRGMFIDNNAIREGLEKARWDGRFQLIQKNPFILIDGAHNAASAAALKRSLRNTFEYNRLILVLGMMRDKDIDGLCRELGDIADYAVVTAAKYERACPSAVIKDKISEYNKGMEVTTADSVAEGIEKTRERAGEKDLVLITGSLYVVAEALQFFQDQRVQLPL